MKRSGDLLSRVTVGIIGVPDGDRTTAAATAAPRRAQSTPGRRDAAAGRRSAQHPHAHARAERPNTSPKISELDSIVQTLRARR